MKGLSFIFGFLIILVYFAEGRIELDIYKTKPPSIKNIKKYYPVSSNDWKNDSIVLYKFLNGEYYGLINVGSPAKTFKVIFDTTWTGTWLPSAHCGWTEIICKLHTQYDSSKSSSYIPNGTFVVMENKELSLKGFLSTDVFRLPHVKIENQTFLEATHISFNPFWQYRADGVIGLAYQEKQPPGTGWDGVVPFFYNLVRQKVVNENIFTFYMNWDETTDKAGKVIFGGTQRNKIINDTLTTLKVIEKKFWMIKIDSVFAEKNKAQTPLCDNCKAIFDTSANTIVGPPLIIEKLNWLMGGQFLPGLNRYTVNCREYAKLPTVHFVFNGNEYIIQSKYYIQHMVLENIEACFSPFVPSSSAAQDYWELGGAFMMQFYTEFDMDKNVVNIAQILK